MISSVSTVSAFESISVPKHRSRPFEGIDWRKLICSKTMVLSIVFLAFVFHAACDTQTRFPAEESKTSSTGIKNEACEMVRTIVSGETSHSDFTRWIFGQPDLMGDALIADFFHNALRVYAKLHQSAIHPDETFNEAFTANRNAMLDVLEIRCGLATNIGAQGLPPGCSMWDQYIVGAISSYQFSSDYVAQIGTPTYWDDYSSELALLSIIFRGANLGNDFSTANADLDWEIGALHTMIDEVCDPNSYRDQVGDQDLSIEDIPPELLPEGFENGG